MASGDVIFASLAVIEHHPEQIIAGLNDQSHCELYPNVPGKLIFNVLLHDGGLVQPLAIRTARHG